MNLRKFVAPNSRSALKLVRAALGPEAVVLSTRQVDGQCEILALPRDEAVSIAQEMPGAPAAAAPAVDPRRARHFQPLEAAAPVAPRRAAAAARAFVVPEVDTTPVNAHPVPHPHPLASAVARPMPQPLVQAVAAPAPQPVASASAAPAPQPAPPALVEELKQLRSLIAAQGASLAWMESGHRRPLRAALMREMLAAGFSAWFARELTDKVPDDFSKDQASAWLREAIQRNLACAASPDSVVEAGGVIALVGPTGVGKTTTTAKLAARCVVRHGAQALGLISTDTYRIGAQDQLRIYGKILGVPVQVCHDADSLAAAIRAQAGKKVVLIDTVGMGQRDPRVREQTAMLESCGARRLLLLNAAIQADALDEVASAYGGAAVTAALTKIDEAVTLGGALEVAMRRRMTLQFITNGQRVPEDLHAASGALLAHRALRVKPKPWSPREEEFGLVAAASHAPLEAARA